MPHTKTPVTRNTIPYDATASVVVFLVALPLCLGVALACGAPLFSGVLAGIIGGIVVGIISRSNTSVSGPAAGLTAVVAAQITALGSFEAFLAAVVIAGVIQIALGLARAGFIAAFFPSSVIKGLLAAIGIILILKQMPHVLGHDTDPEGDMSFEQVDHENTFTELWQLLGDVHPAAGTIGFVSVLLLVAWDYNKRLKKSIVPAPLIVVLLGVALNEAFARAGGVWTIGSSHLVQVPIAESFAEFRGFLKTPDFSQLLNPSLYTAGITLALVASLETLLNLEAVDKLDPQQRNSPPSRELVAQGCGNILSGFVGGLPVTSVIIRSSVNINAGAKTKLSSILHGCLLLGCVAFLPEYLNRIPLSCLAAILLVTGVKLAGPTIIKQMWKEGRYQFIPFAVTVVAIVFTDLLVGILIGLGVSVSFILYSNVQRPLRRIREKHLGGEVLHIQLANQVSFLNRAAITQALDAVPRGGHVLLDARDTVYIDPDVLGLIREFKERTGPTRGVQVSLRGFRTKYQLDDEIQFIDHSTRELQSKLTPAQVLQILKDGHERFRQGQPLSRDLTRQVHATAQGQHPLAVALSCIDSRTPVELIFDLGVGDVFSVRIAGNIPSRKVLGSMEYACAVAGAKLILVMGHTACGAVGAAVTFTDSDQLASAATGCAHLDPIVAEIRESIDLAELEGLSKASSLAREATVNAVARRNVLRSVRVITEQSATLHELVRQGRIAIVGALYDVATGEMEFVTDGSKSPGTQELAAAATNPGGNGRV